MPPRPEQDHRLRRRRDARVGYLDKQSDAGALIAVASAVLGGAGLWVLIFVSLNIL